MKSLSEKLLCEKKAKYHGGIYHKLQIDFAYNSNHIEGSKLSYDQTRYIYETGTLMQKIHLSTILLKLSIISGAFTMYWIPCPNHLQRNMSSIFKKC